MSTTRIDVTSSNGVFEIHFMGTMANIDQPEINVDLGVLGIVNLGLYNDGTRQTIIVLPSTRPESPGARTPAAAMSTNES